MDADDLKLGGAQQDAQEPAREAAPAADQARQAAKAAEEPRAFSAQDLSQPDIGMGAPDLGAAADEGQEFPNGDDPDRVPVTPELPDDKVPNMPGAILKHAREMLGLSQREVALRLQVRVNTVSDIEHDRLNQPTAVPFASAYLTAYAKLVNVDPDAVVSLYRQNVSRAAAEAAATHPEAVEGGQRRRSKPLRLVLIILLAAAVLAIGIVIGALMSGGSQDSEGDSGALTLSPGAQQQVRAASESGEIEPMGPSQDAPAAAPAPEAVDSNTQMARQQAEALGTNEIIAKAQKPQDDKAAPDRNNDAGALSVKGKAAEAAVQGSLKAAAPASKPQEAAAQSAAASNSEQAQSGSGTLALAVPADRRNDAASGSETVRSARSEPAKAASAAKEAKSNEAAPKSLGSVRTVSARVVNRRDIGSLNSVSVRVKGPVYLRIIGNGKVLKQGSFKAGQSVSATGMPPIRIEVSDSSRISVSYNGGTVAAGSGRNVGFTLPTR